MSTAIVKSVNSALFPNSIPHIIMLILKSFGINKFTTLEELAFVSPHAQHPKIESILEPFINEGYIKRNETSFALTNRGNSLLYEVVSDSRRKRKNREVEPD